MFNPPARFLRGAHPLLCDFTVTLCPPSTTSPAQSALQQQTSGDYQAEREQHAAPEW
jgi:hypothetical protein